ncbi:hypothetical protein KC19_VG201300 [Ceratodon purpureus]|uniref:Uncharacterized protein n=1 Tax=Ceratodon purpureus TaxID=3225 RepID=A0A8T0HT25_CERPU|nr:hypothetical protein KC19_VG201300 [Ceratodon purpureus]
MDAETHVANIQGHGSMAMFHVSQRSQPTRYNGHIQTKSNCNSVSPYGCSNLGALRDEERVRLELLESRLLGCEDSKIAMESRLDFIQADVSSTRIAMQELIAIIKKTAAASREPRATLHHVLEVEDIFPQKSVTQNVGKQSHSTATTDTAIPPPDQVTKISSTVPMCLQTLTEGGFICLFNRAHHWHLPVKTPIMAWPTWRFKPILLVSTLQHVDIWQILPLGHR